MTMKWLKKSYIKDTYLYIEMLIGYHLFLF